MRFLFFTTFQLLTIVPFYVLGPPEVGAEMGANCPRECVCVEAPLRAAPFVLTWMTSWGEDDLPETNPNEVLDASVMTSSDTAVDAGVDVELVGLQATCSLHPTTNITTLLQSLPENTMVLTILQAPGCNLTIVDGGQLVGLRSLVALHLQGYAHIKQKQVSGFEPNSISEMIQHKKLMALEVRLNQEANKELRLALAEDALQPLSSLQLLDLQYVRLVASKDARRPRRYSKEPVASSTMLDLPLKQFLRLAYKVDSFYLPPHLQHFDSDQVWHEFLEDGTEDEDSGNENSMERLGGESYKLQRADGNLIGKTLKKKFKSLQDKHESNHIDQYLDEKNEENDDENLSIVPYATYKKEMQPKLAPFKKLHELKYLRVAHARLDRIGIELLDGLQQLHTLTLEYNMIKIIPAGIFEPTPNLRHLSLAHNNVLLLDPDSLGGLSKLYTIDLDHNELSVLGPASFPLLASLKTLRVKENPITHLLPDTFANLNSTENVYLGSRNSSMDVHENSFRFLNNLNSLVLNNVSMERLQKTFLSGMPLVQQLTIHGSIPEIDYDAFSTTPNLRVLNISYCHLSMLSLDAFYELRYLNKLDLSHNDLLAISPGTFDHLVNLRELYLHDNHLTTLPLGIFTPIPVKLIQLHNNPWHCTCDLLQLKPSITNKVRRLGYIACQWDDKLATVCKKTKDRLVYDARVAPLCHEPSELAGNDVYHAALRHLKCSKYHWDPRLLMDEKAKEDEEAMRLLQVKKKLQQKEKEEEPRKDKKEEKWDDEKEENVGWLPLTAFTPEPIDSEDLLEIAEHEGLEEADESSTISPKQPEVSTEMIPTIFNSLPQNDQPNKNVKELNQKLLKYKEIKSQIKSALKSGLFSAKSKAMLHKKGLSYKEKSKLKSLITAKQRGLKLLPKKNTYSDFDDDNVIPQSNFKNNVDIY